MPDRDARVGNSRRTTFGMGKGSSPLALESHTKPQDKTKANSIKTSNTKTKSHKYNTTTAKHDTKASKHDPQPFPQIRKLKGATFHNPYCDFQHYQADHKTHDSTSIKRPGKKIALFEINILGYPTFLCLNCLISFKQDWATALEDLARTSPNFDPVLHNPVLHNPILHNSGNSGHS